MAFGIEDIQSARRRLEGVVKPTPLIASTTLSRMLDAEVLIKPENLQKTGSFKIRGAYNRVATSSPVVARGAVTAATVALPVQAAVPAAGRAGVRATIVMP